MHVLSFIFFFGGNPGIPIYIIYSSFFFTRETMEAYLKELQKLAMTLLEHLGKALMIEMREMKEMFDDGMQSVRITYYPPCPQPEQVMGITPHSDATGITILHQVNGVEGLQLKKDGVWIPVNFHPDAFVVNVGDVLEVWFFFFSSSFSKVR
jgi:isopenicillin N synthase-like dioxygenase